MDTRIEDRALIAQIAAGDAGAMRVLFTRYHGRVLAFIRRILRNEAQAEEVANEVFMQVWRGAASFEDRSSALTWILSIAHHRALNVVRKRSESSWDEDEAAEIPDATDNPEVRLQKSDKGEALRRCSEALPPIYREVIDLVYYHELSIKEVSDVLGIPDGTVKTRLFKARKRLEEMLEAAGIDRGWP
jgi:RNA polymerase sigma-70 factor, ECF subfamily